MTNPPMTSPDIFSEIESSVRSYCRSWPTTFVRAQGDTLYSENGDEYLDFFSGAGALNYGHNPPELREPLIDYLRNDGILHSLDMHTTAKRDFLTAFRDLILRPADSTTG